jgi:hypothetical protein
MNAKFILVAIPTQPLDPDAFAQMDEILNRLTHATKFGYTPEYQARHAKPE